MTCRFMFFLDRFIVGCHLYNKKTAAKILIFLDTIFITFFGRYHPFFVSVKCNLISLST